MQIQAAAHSAQTGISEENILIRTKHRLESLTALLMNHGIAVNARISESRVPVHTDWV